LSLSGIEHVPQTIAQKVEPEDRRDDGEPGRQGDVGRSQEHKLPFR
jgi:hypothetical protein